MTEGAWLASGDTGQLLTYVRKRPPLRGRNRRLTLFAVQSVLRLWSDDPAFRRAALEIAGRVADGEPLSAPDRERISRCGPPDRDRGGGWGVLLSWAFGLIHHKQRWPVEEAAKAIAFRVARLSKRGETAAQCRILRDIYGNPFRPVNVSADWRTDTVLTLARQMYEAHEFSAMPILADALQDAGCDSAEVLDHCRDAKQVHVRGCWVCDLVLGKG